MICYFSAKFNTSYTKLFQTSELLDVNGYFSANDTVYQSQLKDIGSSPVNEKNTYGANRIDVSYFKANRQVNNLNTPGARNNYQGFYFK